MKKLTLTAAGIFASVVLFAQGADRTSAIMAYKDFMKAVQDQNLTKAEKSLLEAKEYIDKAYTAAPADCKTLFYKGEIYSSMPLTILDVSAAAEMMKDPCNPKMKYKAGITDQQGEEQMKKFASEGMEAYKQSIINKNKKDDFTDQIKFKLSMQAMTVFNCGSKAYNNKDYKLAAEHFQGSIEAKKVIGQEDTLSYYNSALAYERLKDNENAAKMWSKCAELKYGGADAYSGMANAYRAAGKEDESLKALRAGRQAYPKDQGLIISEVNYHLSKGDNASAEKAINEAITLDSKNATLFFALGSVYDNLKNYAKAEESYKKAIELDGKYFDALYNLGAMKYNEGAETMNKIKDIADDTQYNAEKAKADAKFKEALPYIEKAREVNPKDKDNLMMLKNIYMRTGDSAKAAEINNLLKN